MHGNSVQTANKSISVPLKNRIKENVWASLMPKVIMKKYQILQTPLKDRHIVFVSCRGDIPSQRSIFSLQLPVCVSLARRDSYLFPLFCKTLTGGFRQERMPKAIWYHSNIKRKEVTLQKHYVVCAGKDFRSICFRKRCGTRPQNPNSNLKRLKRDK